VYRAHSAAAGARYTSPKPGETAASRQRLLVVGDVAVGKFCSPRVEFGQLCGRLGAQTVAEAVVVGNHPERLGRDPRVKLRQLRGRLQAQVGVKAVVVGDDPVRLGRDPLVNPGQLPGRLQAWTGARRQVAAGSAGEPILTAKITPPDVPDWAVERPRITKLITRGARWCPLTVLTGLPGAGKTIALAWCRVAGVPHPANGELGGRHPPGRAAFTPSSRTSRASTASWRRLAAARRSGEPVSWI